MADRRLAFANAALRAKKAPDKPFVALLRLIRLCLPGDYIKTFVYLNFLLAPRKFVRKAVNGFYRMDHIYDVLKEFRQHYEGPFSILEFGTARGYSFSKMLYATRYLGMEDSVTVHAFDTFEGLPESELDADMGLMANDYAQGAYRGNYEELTRYCKARGFKNFKLHKGRFNDTLVKETVDQFRESQPILIWVDCDYYSSSATLFERLLQVIPTGCVLYFDEYDFNFGSRFTGEARLVDEVNRGKFGDNIELVLDPNLSWDSKRIYRFIRFGADGPQYRSRVRVTKTPPARPIDDGSPFP